MKNSKINLIPWEEQLLNVRSNLRNHSDQSSLLLKKTHGKSMSSKKLRSFPIYGTDIDQMKSILMYHNIFQNIRMRFSNKSKYLR